MRATRAGDGGTGRSGVVTIAHRAGNSLEGLRRATALGVDVVEADVHAHRGRLEVRHERTFGPLLWDSRTLRSGLGERLTLPELLLAAAPGVTFMFDLKGRDARLGEQVLAAVRQLAPGRPFLVCSRYWPALRPFEPVEEARVVRSARTRAEFALLLAGLADEPADGGHGGHAVHGVSVHRSLLTPAVVERLHRHVEVVMTWPVNDQVALAEVLALGAGGSVGVISDEEAILARLLARP
jgi:glycerophosphoryl diester phosphodiesterase